MAHEKVYGICEDKCKVEVIPKGNIVVMSGELHVSYDSDLGAGQSQDVLDYPEGFTGENTILLSAMVDERASCSPTYMKYIGGGLYPEISLYEGYITVNVIVTNSVYDGMHKWKIVLLRLDDPIVSDGAVG